MKDDFVISFSNVPGQFRHLNSYLLLLHFDEAGQFSFLAPLHKYFGFPSINYCARIADAKLYSINNFFINSTALSRMPQACSTHILTILPYTIDDTISTHLLDSYINIDALSAVDGNAKCLYDSNAASRASIPYTTSWFYFDINWHFADARRNTMIDYFHYSSRSVIITLYFHNFF
jgi:hypothetical protein